MVVNNGLHLLFETAAYSTHFLVFVRGLEL